MKWPEKKIEERENEFRAMAIRRSEVLQRKLHEESLLARRLMLFLLTISILFVSFATLLSLKGEAWGLLLAVSIVGICVSGLLIPYSLSAKIELDILAKLLSELRRSGFHGIVRGANAGLRLAALFLVIWGMSIFEVIC